MTMNVQPIFISIVMLELWRLTKSTTASFGLIRNASLTIPQGSTSTIHGTCESCLCALVSDPSLFSLNCFPDNLTCEMHSKLDQDKPFTLMNSTMSDYYFISLPKLAVEYLWTFDSTFQDVSGIFNTIPMNGPNFSSTSITGYGSSLSLSSSMSQSLKIPTPRLKLYNQSWTFEAWIYPTSLGGGDDYVIVAQCDAQMNESCFHILIRSHQLYFGHFNDDASGTKYLTTARWYHVGFTFDCGTRTISIYLDGMLDASHQLKLCFQGVNQSMTVGSILSWPWDGRFDGLIDELSFTNRTKTADEILRDATLVAHFSFDDNSTYDQGPLRINGSLVGNTTFVPGRVGQALEIQNVNQSYFKVQGLVLLGLSVRSYSFSIWIRPKVQQKSVIIHGSSFSNGSGWFIPFLHTTATYQLASYSWNGSVMAVTGPVIPTDSWTHAAVTYSFASGLKLYVNGNLSDTSAQFSYDASGAPMYLFVGSLVSSVGWGVLSNNSDQYCGAVDELRVYSRELTTGDIVDLANPSP